MSSSFQFETNNNNSDHIENGFDSSTFKCHSKAFSTIPGPWPSLPFIGTGWHNFYSSLIGRYDLSKLHEVYVEKYRYYGPIFKEEFQWGKPIVNIFDPADFETVFKSLGRSPIRPPSEFLCCFRLSRSDRYPNVGLANMNGDEWFEHRHRLAPAIMKLKTINENMVNQNKICQDFLDYLWHSRDPKTNIVKNVQEATYRLALESICMLCLDSRIGAFLDDLDSKQTDGEILIEATKLQFDTFNKLYYGFPFWKFFNTSVYNDLIKAESIIYDVASKYVEQAISDLSIVESDRQSVLQTLLNTDQLTKKEVKIVIIDFIIGGIFTVSNTLAYLFYHMAANQRVQEKLYEEIQTVKNEIPVSDDQDPMAFLPNHIAKMPYLKACVQECFRLNCPVPGIVRVTEKPIVLSGYNIPENTIIFSHLMATCRLEEYFKNADQFLPERWIDPDLKSSIHPFSLLPFGFGSRMCLGKRFSETEIYLSLARLIQSFKFELAPKNQPLELNHAFIVIPAKPISIRLTQR